MVREDRKLGHFVGIGGLGGSGSVTCLFSFFMFFFGRMKIADGGNDTIVYLFVCGFAREYLVRVQS